MLFKQKNEEKPKYAYYWGINRFKTDNKTPARTHKDAVYERRQIANKTN